MKFEDLVCQHGNRVVDCDGCKEFRAGIAAGFRDKERAALEGNAKWLDYLIKKDGAQAALGEVVRRLTALEIVLMRVNYSFVEAFTQIALAESLRDAHDTAAVVALVCKEQGLGGWIVDQALIDKLDEVCTETGAYESLASRQDLNEGARGASILRDVKKS